MSKNSDFYVAFFDFEKHKFSFSVSESNDFEKDEDREVVEFEDYEKSITNVDTGRESQFGSLFVNFVDSMLGYMEFLRFIASFSSVLSFSMAKELILQFVKENGSLEEDSSQAKIYRIPKSKQEEFYKLRDALKSSRAAGKKIPEMLLMGLVSVYEHNISLLARLVIERNPKILDAKEMSFTLSDVMSFDDLPSLKNSFIEKEIENIFRDSAEKQIEWFEKRLKIEDIKSNHENMNRLLELFQRRNLIAHSNSIVNDIYLSNVDPVYIKDKNIEKGDYLPVNGRYFTAALELLIEFGVKLTQVCWRKLDPSDTEIADRTLHDFAYELLVRGEYTLACDILEFGRSLRGRRAKDIELMFLVNHANALKLSGHEEKALKVLEKEDWSACSDAFRCCVAAVKGDLEAVVQHMEAINQSNAIRSIDYQEWPVFYHVRESKTFIDCYESIFGEPYQPADKIKTGVFDAFMASTRKSRPEQLASSVCCRRLTSSRRRAAVSKSRSAAASRICFSRSEIWAAGCGRPASLPRRTRHRP
jgi:hypothetical protein